MSETGDARAGHGGLVGNSGREWTIRRGGQVATVVEVGAALRRYEVDDEPLVAGFAAGEASPAFRGKLLVPWPNRIGDGEYTFGGVTRRLAHTEPERANALGGLACWVPFEVDRVAAHEITLAATLFPQPGWDWPVRVAVTYALDDEGLRVTTRATNLAATPAPFGFGAHPYLTAGEGRVDELVVRVPAASVLDVDDRLLPRTGPGGTPVARPVAGATDLRLDTPLGARDLDLAYTELSAGADGQWRAELRGPRRTTVLWADAHAFPWVQVYTGGTLPEPARRRTGVAVEPMTCPPDAFASGRDLLTLAPRGTWTGTYGLTRPRP